MKSIKILILLLTTVGFASAQNINWAALKDDNKNFLSLNAGLEYGMVMSAGYGYKLPAKPPIILDVDYSQPVGSKTFDDLKSRIGGQLRVIQYGNFAFTARVHGVFRTYNNSLVRMTNFGSDLSGIIGYYRPKWFAAVEVGFDKAIVTKFKNSEIYKGIYPGAKDGWYQPATGGNFYTGIIAGMSFGRTDVYLNAGRIATEDFKGAPYMPYFGKAGVTYKFGK